jgi:mRNA-degrading endonuclease toxin of MazEF toxin-antitoxin module
MRFSDVKEKYLYYVDFDPVKECEFDRKHLAVVLKKNNDKKTAIVMPLTSKKNGVGKNKLLIPTIEDLPERLKGDDSYAVYDQVRSVNFRRFEPIFKEKNGQEIVNVKMDDELFILLIEKGTEELEKKLSLEEKLKLYNKKLNKSINEKIVNMAYEIKKSKEDKEKIKRIETEIKEIVYNNMKYIFTEKEKEDGIEDMILAILSSKK